MIVKTPGKLGVDILCNNSQSIQDRFWQTFAVKASESVKDQWQELITATGLSSHMMVNCLAPTFNSYEIKISLRLIPILLEQTKLEAEESVDMMLIFEIDMILPMVTTFFTRRQSILLLIYRKVVRLIKVTYD